MYTLPILVEYRQWVGYYQNLVHQHTIDHACQAIQTTSHLKPENLMISLLKQIALKRGVSEEEEMQRFRSSIQYSKKHQPDLTWLAKDLGRQLIICKET